MKRIVVKFGGTSVMDTERIKKVAAIVADIKKDGLEVVVVVSAMGHTTDHLLSLSDGLGGAQKSERELDMLLSTGELVSATLTAIALQNLGVAAQSFTGAAAGIVTDNKFGQARIKHVHTEALHDCLEKGVVPVVAGFQGICEQGFVTTLGRGGSDTTAIALAASLHADCCDIYSDVDGVYSADPRQFGGAVKLSRVNYQEMHELAMNGAQILNARSVEMAMRRKVEVRVRSTFSPSDRGTVVTAEARQPVNFTGIACSESQDYVRMRYSLPGAARLLASGNMRQVRLKRLLWKKTLLSMLAGANIHVEVGTTLKTCPGELHFCVARPDVPAVRKLFAEALPDNAEMQVGTGLVKVSLVAREINSFIEVEAIVALTRAGIPISLITTCEHRLSLFVPSDMRDPAVALLHNKFAGLKIAA